MCTSLTFTESQTTFPYNLNNKHNIVVILDDSLARNVRHDKLAPPRLQACVSLMRQLYSRDLRRSFCPEGHWISQPVTMSLAIDRPSDATLRRRSRLRQHYRPFHFVPAFTREELGKNCQTCL